MLRILIALLPLGVLAVAQDGAKPVARWIRDLGAEDPATRESARRSILDAGTDALAGLRAAVDDGDPERRNAVKRLVQAIERTRDWRRDLRGELDGIETHFLETAGLLPGLDARPATDGLPATAADVAGDPIWNFIPEALFAKPALVGECHKDAPPTNRSGQLLGAALRSGDDALFIRECPELAKGRFGGGRFPRYYLLERAKERFAIPAKVPEAGKGGFDLSRITGFKTKQPTDLYLAQAEILGSPGALYCSFHWGEDKPFPNVRHVLVKEHWLLIVIDYQS